MYKDVLRSIEGAEIFQVIALILFGIVLVGAWVYALTARTDFMREMKELPLESHKPSDSSHEK